ncbi:glycoside hydrolase family 1 protein [Allosphingosinicella deserti]|uniref:B-glycosidase n=1 Tax=Allosphingosinicella deserti TaxID=2116704 RepID=A0A2P7QHE4_9SPHN|nr:b-glycosidase [Sphingomonas deserti]PSJ37375.1 b-glycosidase [Sphingomonas deserti]
MPTTDGLFPTFFLSGFECSTFDWKDVGRRDLTAEIQHNGHADEDYAFLRSLGIAVAREGIPWPLIDRGGGDYDFSCIDTFLAAQRRHAILPIWDLCHYGYPAGLDPLSDAFVERFAAFARAAARYVAERAHHGPLFFTPMNEPTFWGYMGGEWAWSAPFGTSADYRRRFTTALARADIAAVKTIRADFPDARMVHIDPLIWVVPPRNRPDLAEAAHRESYDDAYLAWDVISGLRCPELGGSPEILDIIGLNNYSFGQMEYREQGPHAALEPGDDRIRPLCDLIEEAWRKYRRPCIVAETSGLKGGRPDWLNDIVVEGLAAIRRGVDLHGLCLFPAIDMPDWHNGQWLNNGIADVRPLPDGTLMRVPYLPYVECLHRWQRKLNRVTSLDNDPFDAAVDLADIRRAADEMNPSPDADWH